MISFEWLAPALSTFLLIALAEIGDKSQLVCMALAARHRGLPVIVGAAAAFSLLNVLAVAFGAGLAHWIAPDMLAFGVAILFAVFGIQALRTAEDEDDEVKQITGHGLFVTTFLLIFVAEFGDKTQIAISGMATGAAAVPVWLGGTLALVSVSALGVLAGRTILQKLPVHILHRVAGGLFLVFAVLALLRGLKVL